jgi:hypothetical protein
MANTPMVPTNVNDGDWIRQKIDFNTANTETASFVLPKGAIIHPDFIYVDVVTADSAITVDVGILSTETGGDADGLCDGLSVASTGIVRPALTITQGTNAQYVSATTYGILIFPTALKGANTSGHNAVARLLPFLSNGIAQTVSYTVLTGADTFVGYLCFRVFMCPSVG